MKIYILPENRPSDFVAGKRGGVAKNLRLNHNSPQRGLFQGNSYFKKVGCKLNLKIKFRLQNAKITLLSHFEQGCFDVFRSFYHFLHQIYRCNFYYALNNKYSSKIFFWTSANSCGNVCC